jgi:hypothetical protein
VKHASLLKHRNDRKILRLFNGNCHRNHVTTCHSLNSAPPITVTNILRRAFDDLPTTKAIQDLHARYLPLFHLFFSVISEKDPTRILCDFTDQFTSRGRGHQSYARKLVTVISGGVFDLLDPVLERHSFDDLGKAA